MKRALTRRELIVGGASGYAGLCLGGLNPPSFAESANPHFLLHICVSGGVDSTCTFDARGLEFTDRNLVPNFGYRNDNKSVPLLPDPKPRLYKGSNGQSLLRSSISDVILPSLPYLTVVNGVMMDPQTNGHGSNMYYMFTNSANNGASFMPMIGKLRKTPLEAVHFGGWEGDGNRQPTNFGKSVQLGYDQGNRLAEDLVTKRRYSLDSRVSNYLNLRLAERAKSASKGAFTDGIRQFASSLSRQGDLAGALKTPAPSIAPPTDPLVDKNVVASLGTAMSYFSGGLTHSITLMFDRDPNIDTHSASNAQKQIEIYKSILATLQFVFDAMRKTEFQKSGKSFWDVTTVMVSSEFSRTLRQFSIGDPKKSVGNTGTDHNNLCNTFLFGGKGIRAGQVIGASDLDSLSAQGTFSNVSGAHLKRDSKQMSIMAKPFDFAKGAPSTELPTEFKPEHYLNVASLVNSVFSMFDVPSTDWFRVAGRAAPVLTSLLG